MNRPDADDVTTTKWSLKPVGMQGAHHLYLLLFVHILMIIQHVYVSRSKLLFRLMRSVYFNRVVYFYIFTATSNLFLPILNIFMHIPSYFHVYLYLYLLRFYLYLLRFTYFYLHLLRFTTKVWYFTTVYHNSVIFLL